MTRLMKDATWMPSFGLAVFFCVLRTVIPVAIRSSAFSCRLAMSSVDDQASVKSSEEGSGPRIKFLCSYGGKILPKPDGQLRYVGGDTRLLSVRRNIGFSELRHKLEKLFGPNLWMKYQLPNEDLDALISVTCDDDVENLIEEYDRNEARDGASRLRAYLFPRVEVTSKVAVSSSDHVVDEDKSPNSFSESKCAEIIDAPRAQARMWSDSPSVAFKVPDYLFGLDSGGHDLSHHQQDGDSRSPRRYHSPVEKRSPLLPSIPPLEHPAPISLQPDYARQQSPRMDSGGRGPALVTSALGPLTSSYHHTWENKKLWDVGVPGDQKDEKRPVDLNEEPNYVKLQRDACANTGIARVPSKDRINTGMARIPSKDRIVSMYMEGSHADIPSMTDRQGRLQPIMHKLEELHTDVSSDGGQEAGASDGFSLHWSPEVQRIPLSTPNVAASDVPWGLSQSSVPVFQVVGDRPTEGYRHSGDPEDGMHKKGEGLVTVDNASHPHPTIATSEGSVEGFRYQDGPEAYPGQQNQQRQVEFEASSPVHAQREAAHQIHRLGKGHFQQVYWQLRDPQEHPQQQQTALHEPICVVHGSSAMQRPVQPVNHHQHSPGQPVYHNYMPQGNVRTMQRPDTNTRHGSPSYRQAAMAGGPQQLSRGVSPLHEHHAGHDAHNSPRYGHRVAHIHEMGYLPSNIAQQSAGLPMPLVYGSDPAEAHNLYEQSAGHLPRVPSPLHEHATGKDSSLRYGQRVIQMHETGYLPSTAQQTSGITVPPMYASDVAEAHGLYDKKGGQLGRAPSPLREHPGQRVLQIHETGYLPPNIYKQSSGHPVPPVYVSDLSEAHSHYDQDGGQLHYAEKGVLGNHDGSIGQVQYSDKVANHNTGKGQTHYPDDKLQNPQYVLMSNNQDIQGGPLHQDAAGVHSH